MVPAYAEPANLQAQSTDGERQQHSGATAPLVAEPPRLQAQSAEGQGISQQQPRGAHARIKALMRRQDDGELGSAAESCEPAQALTQAEVIEAQTADQEKPVVTLVLCMCPCPGLSLLCVL